jgi:uncharacterized membrane protein
VLCPAFSSVNMPVYFCLWAFTLVLPICLNVLLFKGFHDGLLMVHISIQMLVTGRVWSYTFVLSYSGGMDRRITVWGWVWAKMQDPIQKNH